MLVGGADVSGSEADGQQNHVALVVGKEDAINRIYKNVGISPIHMSEMSERQRRQVQDNLDLSSSEIAAWCFHISRQRIENAMQDLIISGKKRKPKINIHRSFESYWFQLFRGELAAFAAKFGWTFRTLPSESMPICAPPSKTGRLTIGIRAGRTSWPTRWLGLTRGESRYKTARPWICGTA